jgi:hypothetical protein
MGLEYFELTEAHQVKLGLEYFELTEEHQVKYNKEKKQLQGTLVLQPSHTGTRF